MLGDMPPTVASTKRGAAPRPHGDMSTRFSEVTLHQLRVFWAVAHSDTLTLAAKQMGLAQPTLSQQLSKLETTIGTKLFHRRSNEMELTEAGHHLLVKAEQVLRSMREFEDGFAQFSSGQRTTVHIAGISSMLRRILPEAISRTQALFPGADFDIHDSSPADVLELLYARRANLGLVAANSVAEAALGFVQVPVIADPYVLVVPERLDLAGVSDPETDLSPEDRDLLGRSVLFTFGTAHANRVVDWCDRALPRHRVVAQCRSFEVAISLVRAGSGVCLAPALSTASAETDNAGVRRYLIPGKPRQIVALVPSQYQRLEPYATLLEQLQSIGSTTPLPVLELTPAFLKSRPDVEL